MKKQNQVEDVRVLGYDILRIFAVLGVVGIHTTQVLLDENIPGSAAWWSGNIVHTVSRIGLTIFIILSGTLNLCRNNLQESYVRFYKKKIINIAIPFLIYALGYEVIKSIQNGRKGLSIFHDIPVWLQDIYSNNVFYHMWFVYMIMAVYLMTPMLQIMLRNMSVKLQKIMALIFVGGLLIRNGSALAGYELGLGKIPLEEVYYFIFGFFLLQPWMKKFYKGILCIGSGCFILSLLIKRYATDIYMIDLYGESFIMLMESMAVYIFCINRKYKIGRRMGEFIQYFSKRSFGIYLVHAGVLSMIHNMQLFDMRKPIDVLGLWTVTVIISFLTAILLDRTVVMWTQNIVSKWIKLENLQGNDKR